MRSDLTSLAVWVRYFLACMLLCLPPANRASAQDAASVSYPDDDSQLWTSVQFALPLRERIDLILLGSLRQGRDFTHPVFEAGGSALRLRLGRYFALSPMYQFVATQNYPGVHTIENRLFIGGVFTIPVKRLVVEYVHQLEQRFREPRNSSRYRNRIQVEWPFRFRGGDYRLFSWDEVAYDWNHNAWSRNRLAVGGGKRLRSNFGIDLFFMKQNARFSLPRDINVIGVTFRIQLDRAIHHQP
jgi:Protein of unknown function (DUF2490)